MGQRQQFYGTLVCSISFVYRGACFYCTVLYLFKIFEISGNFHVINYVDCTRRQAGGVPIRSATGACGRVDVWYTVFWSLLVKKCCKLLLRYILPQRPISKRPGKWIIRVRGAQKSMSICVGFPNINHNRPLREGTTYLVASLPIRFQQFGAIRKFTGTENQRFRSRPLQ